MKIRFDHVTRLLCVLFFSSILAAGCSTPQPTVSETVAPRQGAALFPPGRSPGEYFLGQARQLAKERDERDEADRVARTVRVGDFDFYWRCLREDETWYRVEGTVKNLGDRRFARIPVIVTILDDSGKTVIDSKWRFAVDVLPLGPGETRRWTMLVKGPAPSMTATLGEPMDRL